MCASTRPFWCRRYPRRTRRLRTNSGFRRGDPVQQGFDARRIFPGKFHIDPPDQQPQLFRQPDMILGRGQQQGVFLFGLRDQIDQIFPAIRLMIAERPGCDQLDTERPQRVEELSGPSDAGESDGPFTP